MYNTYLSPPISPSFATRDYSISKKLSAPKIKYLGLLLTLPRVRVAHNPLTFLQTNP